MAYEGAEATSPGGSVLPVPRRRTLAAGLPGERQGHQMLGEPSVWISRGHPVWVGLTPRSTSAVCSLRGSTPAHTAFLQVPGERAGSLLLPHEDGSQPAADVGIPPEESVDVLLRADPKVPRLIG
jgi:hypothetical protein